MGNKFSGARLRSIVNSPQQRRKRRGEKKPQDKAQEEVQREDGQCDTETEQDLENYVAELQMLEAGGYLSPCGGGKCARAYSAQELDLELDLPGHLRLQ